MESGQFEVIHKYFPGLTSGQIQQFEKFSEALQIWNPQINVISRKDIGELEIHHLLHSLTIAHYCTFNPGARVLDAGTGGGFPGIPLAILFPEVEFVLVDSIAKKIKVVSAIIEAAELKNVKAICSRTEVLPSGQADYVVSRAVSHMKEFIQLVKHLLIPGQQGTLPSGILYLKGGDLEAELAAISGKITTWPLFQDFPLPYFETKFLVHLKLSR